MRQPRQIIISGLAVSLLIAPMGCASTECGPGGLGCSSKKQRPLALSEEFRAQFTTIGIVSARSLPAAKLELPAKGSLKGAGEGAKAGAAVGVLPGLAVAGGGPYGPVIGIPLAAAGAIVGALVGSTYGAFAAEPAAKVEEAEATLTKAIAELKIQETLEEHVLKQAREETRYAFIPLKVSAFKDRDGHASYHDLENSAIGTILETSVLSFGLTAQSLGPTPPLAMFMKVRVRLIDPTVGNAFYDEAFEFKTEFYEYAQWTGDDGQRFLDALIEGYQSLAAQIVYELFLLYPMPSRVEAGQYYRGPWFSPGY